MSMSMDIKLDIKGNGKDVIKSNFENQNKPYKPPNMPPVTVKNQRHEQDQKKGGKGTKTAKMEE